jgi:multisubunit Na+/H+ antiporter MnhB subunit
MKISSSFIFSRVAVFLFFVINVFAVYLLLRGHNHPGGGFIGGLASGMSLVLLGLAVGVERMQQVLRFDPVRIAAVGLLIATTSAAMPMLWGDPFLTQYNMKLGSFGLGTPLVFDLGVFLTVVGVTVRLIAILARPVEGLCSLTPIERSVYASSLEQPIDEGEAQP